MASSEKKCYLFVGNPGAGKSTILNGIIGEPKFVAKMALDGNGITYQFDKVEIPGKGVFMDTPGLSDEKLRNQAAEAITTALKQDGYYKIFFVLTVESGRVRPDDKTTMKLILEASPEITNYSIIVNKASPKWATKVQQPKYLSPFMTNLMAGLPVVTSSAHFMLQDDDLEDEDNVKYTAPQDVLDFVRDAPGMTINSATVTDVKASEFDAMREENKKLQKELEDSKEKMQAETARVEEAMKAQIEAARQEVEKVRDAAEGESAKMRKMVEDTREEGKKQLEETKKEAEMARMQAQLAAAGSGNGRQNFLGALGNAFGSMLGL